MRMRRSGEEELAALADGSLAPEHRAELEARIDASPILADRLAEQERAVALLRGAGDEVEAPAGLRARLDAQRSARTVRTPRRLALGGVAAAAVAAAAIVAVVVVGSGSSGTRFQAALGPTPLARGAQRPGDTDQDVVRVANPPRRHGTSAPRGRPLLRGLVAELRRRARADRDVQRRPERHALGRGFARELHRADRHARAGGRQPGLIGPEGARRPGPHGLIRLTPIRRRSAARPAGGRGRGGS